VSQINYVTGDLFKLAPGDKPIVIPHICNDLGKWGSGFVVPLGQEFPRAKAEYLRWAEEQFDHERNIPFERGQVQIVRVAQQVFVANMVAQKGLISPDNPHPIVYSALYNCMVKLFHQLIEPWKGDPMSICAPKFGSLRAGGDWGVIEKLIVNNWVLVPPHPPVTIYSLENPV
jgi:hypothetical protein